MEGEVLPYKDRQRAPILPERGRLKAGDLWSTVMDHFP